MEYTRIEMLENVLGHCTFDYCIETLFLFLLVWDEFIAHSGWYCIIIATK